MQRVRFAGGLRACLWAALRAALRGGLRLSLCSLLAGAVVAAEPDDDLFELGLDELKKVNVVTAARKLQSLTEAPAVISVISADEIAAQGYRSVADALQQVPGLYGIDDGMTESFGVRGVASGLRAANRPFKVLIDGQSVQFRADGTHYLGLEFLPISVVDRIEVVRGPASALYGADAFLGVINIITRLPTTSSGRGDLHGQHEAETGALASVRLALAEGRWRLQLGVQGGNEDYSGRELPRSSPLYDSFVEHTAQNAQRKPRTGLFRLHGEWDGHRSDFYWHGLRLDSIAEFTDFGALSHQNRIALEQDSYWWQGAWQWSDAWSLDARVAQSRGAPADREQLSLASGPLYPARQFAFDVRELGAQVAWQGEQQRLSAGVDFSEDDETLMQVFSVDSDTGTRTPQSPDQGHQTFRNRGLFVQYQYSFWSELALTANWRHDDHNIYGRDNSGRLALVWQADAALTVKLMSGSSYKAPAASQLYAQPLYAGDLVANPALQPERAKMHELAIDWRPAPAWWWRGNLYQLTVEDKVEVLLEGGEYLPRNVAKQEGWGAESELQWHDTDTRQRWQWQLAWQDTEEAIDDVFRGELRAPTERYPGLWWRLAWQWQAPIGGELAVSVRGASARRASKENITENLLRAYELPSYRVWRLAWRWPQRDYGVQLTVDNAVAEDYAEPGFAGIDLPGRQRTVTLSGWLEWGAGP